MTSMSMSEAVRNITKILETSAGIKEFSNPCLCTINPVTLEKVFLGGFSRQKVREGIIFFLMNSYFYIKKKLIANGQICSANHPPGEILNFFFSK